MPVRIHNKEYLTVAERITLFRKEYRDYGIDTELISNADFVVVKAVIYDLEGKQVGSGYAEEERGSSNINKTSALENCETSAIGRALASFGFGGDQYGSANEVGDAMIKQAKIEAVEFYAKMQKAVRDNFYSIAEVKRSIAANELDTAREAYQEINEEDAKAIWVAPTKGGIFTTEEREIIKQGFK